MCRDLKKSEVLPLRFLWVLIKYIFYWLMGFKEVESFVYALNDEKCSILLWAFPASSVDVIGKFP